MPEPKDSWEIDPEEPLSLEEVPFTPYEMEVREHWERFQPTLVRQLRAQGPGKLEQAIRRAVHRQMYQEDLMLAQNPALHRGQVEELFREEVFPPPEDPPDRVEPRFQEEVLPPPEEPPDR